MWAVYTYVVANLDEMLPRLDLAAGEEAPTQAELDELFGPVDLGPAAVCLRYAAGQGGACTIESGAGAFGLLLVGAGVGVAAAAAAGEMWGETVPESEYKKIEMSPINRESSE